MNFSLQLWSLKDEAAADFKGTLKNVADCGYEGVEFAGYGDLTSDEMKAELAKNGLKSLSSHTALTIFENSFKEELEYHKNLGTQYIIIPWADLKTIDDVNHVVELLNNCGKIAREYGIKVGYHNHNKEFEKIDGKYILDIIAENTTDDVIVEVDVFWVAYAGLNPEEYIAKLGKKVELVHLKQIGEDNVNVDFADGFIDMENIIKTSKFAKYFIVEQEHTASTPLQSVKNNAEYLKKITL